MASGTRGWAWVLALGLAGAVACGGDGGGAAADGAAGSGDAAGDAAGTSGDADAAADGAPEVGPGEDAADDAGDGEGAGLALPAGLVADACSEACGEIALSCGLKRVGGSVSACEQACATAAAEDGWWLATWRCYADGCDADACGVGAAAPLDAVPACDEGCAALDACDLLGVVELPEDEPALCRALCAGGAAASPALLDAVACVTAAADPTCDAAGVTACVGGAPQTLCGVVCSALMTPGGDEHCAPGTALRAAWPDLAACLAVCDGLPDGAAQVRMWGCVLARDCGDPAPCEAPPAQDAAACADACGPLLARCGPFGGISDAPTCSQLCTGVLHGLGAEGSAGAAACAEALDPCPAGDAAFGALLGCALAPSEDCALLCDEVAPCYAPGELDPTECRTGCALGQVGPPEQVATVAACVAAVDPSDPVTCAQAGACFPPPPADPICGAACAKLSQECGLGLEEACVGSCEQALGEGGPQVADKVCRALAPCPGQGVCAGLDTADPACEAACAGAPGTCGAYGGGCAFACTGALVGLSLDGAQAGCVVASLGDGCDVAAAASCQAP